MAGPSLARHDRSGDCKTSCAVDRGYPANRSLLLLPSETKISQRSGSAHRYTTISLGHSAGFIAVGKNIQTISDLQSRLALAQEARERDHWKIREMETRYRLLFDATNEAVLLVRVTNMRIAEANLNAGNFLGLLPGAEVFPDLDARDRKAFQSLLEKVREYGRAPGIVLHIGAERQAWSLRASLVNSEAGSFYLFQLAPIGVMGRPADVNSPPSLESLVQRMPEGFVVVDREGVVQRANDRFLDLAEIGAEAAISGQSMKKYLSEPGADLPVILSLVERHGAVRLLSTTLCGELGSLSDVEVSATGDRDQNPEYVGLLIRDVTSRSTSNGGRRSIAEPEVDAFENLSLEQCVREATETVERRTIVAALAKAEGNRTAAAKMLDLSRQSLHTKLKKYSLG